MILSRITLYTHANDLGGKVWNPAIRWTTKYAVFVVLEDDSGATGLGECWCFDVKPDALVAYLKTEIIPNFIGCDMQSYAEIAHGLYSRATLTARHGLLSSALSGFDIALNDLQSQRAGTALCNWLNPNKTRKVPVYASGGLYGQNKDIEALCAEMKGMADAGFTLVKMKTGGLSVEEDAERINSVLAVLDSNVSLIIDGVYSYSVNTASSLLSKISADRIEAFQSPLPAQDIDGMSDLNNAGVPVMATEAEYRFEVHRQLVEKNAVTYLQTAPIAVGGFAKLKELDELLESSSIKLSLEVSSTAVAFLAASHFASAYPNVAHVEYHTLHQVFYEQMPSVNRMLDDAGTMEVPNATGLGLTLDTQKVSEEFSLQIS